MFALLFLVVFIGIIVVSVMSYDSKTTNIYHNLQENRGNEANTCAISFPEYDPEEYQRQKQLRNDKALNGCEFWDGINIDFEENIRLLNAQKCPYCSLDLPIRKSKSYKCPSCGGKVYRLKDLISDFEGLFTQEQKEIREQLKKELSRRKNFLKIFQEAFEDCTATIISVKLPIFTSNKQENISRVMSVLHEATPHLKKPEKINGLRMCRFYEAKMQELYGNKEDALNAWLSVAYIDLWGFYNYLYEDREDYKNTFDEKDEELFYKIKQAYEATGNKYYYSSFEEYKNYEIEKYNKSRKPFNYYENSKVAPYVVDKIKKFNYNSETLKYLFLGHAKMVGNSVKYTPPLTPEKAWEKFFNQYLTTG